MKKQEELLWLSLLEATLWERSLTGKEKSSMPFEKARENAIGRIFKKYKNKILK